MPRKQYHQLRLDNLQDNLQHNVNTLATVLSYMDRGRLIITLEIEGTRLHLLKKKYFAMVKELAQEAGYRSPEELELFKHQIKQVLGVDSIQDIKDEDVMSNIVEALYREASESFNFRRFTCDTERYQFEDPDAP